MHVALLLLNRSFLSPINIQKIHYSASHHFSNY
ncbi:hypothetical protein VCHENC02_0385, partial [Vibrio harveyi]